MLVVRRRERRQLVGLAHRDPVGRAAAPVDNVPIGTVAAEVLAPIDELEMVVEVAAAEGRVEQHRVKKRLTTLNEKDTSLISSTHLDTKT